MRQKMIAFRADGTKAPLYRCAEATAPAADQEVTAEVCNGCSVLPTILAREATRRPERVKFETLHLVRDRQSDAQEGDGWPGCKHREIATVSTCCGGTYDARICTMKDAEFYEQEVARANCKGCPKRSI